MSKRTVELTDPERRTLLELLHTRLDQGWYYGNQKHYTARVKRLIAKLSEAPR